MDETLIVDDTHFPTSKGLKAAFDQQRENIWRSDGFNFTENRTRAFSNGSPTV